MGREVATEAPEGKGSPLDAKAPEGGGSPLDAKAPEDGDGRQEALVTLNVPEPGGAEPVAESSLPYASLVQVGINVKMGLDHRCGEEDFYLEMLQTFHSQGAEKKAEIVALYEAENWTDYAIKVHALKSTSLTIGAERLSEQAKALEQAGKSGDVEYVRRNHPALLRSYEEVCESIAAL